MENICQIIQVNSWNARTINSYALLEISLWAFQFGQTSYLWCCLQSFMPVQSCWFWRQAQLRQAEHSYSLSRWLYSSFNLCLATCRCFLLTLNFLVLYERWNFTTRFLAFITSGLLEYFLQFDFLTSDRVALVACWFAWTRASYCSVTLELSFHSSLYTLRSSTLKHDWRSASFRRSFQM